MTVRLVGPYPLDLQNPARGAELAVRATLRAGAPGEPTTEDGSAPGLYGLVSTPSEGGPHLVGVWATLDDRWLEDGPPSGAAQLPPIVGALLHAFVEASWWRSLPSTRVLRPWVVLEWGARLTARSNCPPELGAPVAPTPPRATPSEPARSPAVATAPTPVTLEEWDASGNSLSSTPSAQPPPSVVDPTPVPPATPAAEPPRPTPSTPTGPSLIAVARGNLRLERGRHVGTYRLILPHELTPPGVGASAPVPPEDWLGDREPAPSTSDRRPGSDPPSLALPGGRVGLALPGWLSRELELAPLDGVIPSPAQLVERDVRGAWIPVATSTALSTISVLALAIGIAELARFAGAAEPQPSPPAPKTDPGPAISPCSADHDPFMEELRCQIARMVDPERPLDGTARCRDLGSDEAPQRTDEDLQAAVCGVLDRARDGWTGNLGDPRDLPLRKRRSWDFAELAASQACLNVLDHPGTYRQPGAPEGTAWADPDRFLRDPGYSISSLQGLLEDLRTSCDGYRERLEASVKGAVVSTHIGGPPAEGAAGEQRVEFRQKIKDYAAKGIAETLQPCFENGFSVGFRSPRPKKGEHPLWEVCGDVTAWDQKQDARRAWKLLAGSADRPAIDRYVEARFGANRPAASGDLVWACHLALERDQGGALPSEAAKVAWGLKLPVPRFYAWDGAGAPGQLVLDAALREAEAGGLEAGVCWDLVREQLEAYQPVHPLLAELDGDRWVSDEQQLCAQICAASWKVRSPARSDGWWTHARDLQACLSTSEQLSGEDIAEDGLDHLRLPWNQSWYRWAWTRERADRPRRRVPERQVALTRIEPSSEQICAFHILAQDLLLPDGSAALVGGKSGEDWAGTASPGSRLAGGPTGSALTALSALKLEGGPSPDKVTGQYGRDICGDIASQCFTTMALTTLATPQRYRWLETWEDMITTFRARDLEAQWADDPWCASVIRYIGAGDEQQSTLDKSCRDGVNEARQTVARAISLAASGRAPQEAP